MYNLGILPEEVADVVVAEAVVLEAVDSVILEEVIMVAMLEDMAVDQVVMETMLDLETLVVVAEVMAVSSRVLLFFTNFFS